MQIVYNVGAQTTAKESKKSYYALFQESPGWLLRLGFGSVVLSWAMEPLFKKGWARHLYLSD